MDLQKELDAVRKDRDYCAAKWRLFEMECNRLGSDVSHNPLTKEQVEFLLATRSAT